MNSQFKSTVKREVYFDTNVYTHIYHAIMGHKLEQSYGLKRADVDQLMHLLRSNRLRVLASYVNYEETLSAILSDEDEAFGRLKLIRKLTEKKRIIKYHTELLQDDILAFARGEKLKSPFASPHIVLKELVSKPSQTDRQQLRLSALEAQTQIKEKRKNHNNDLAKTKEFMEQGGFDKELPTFEEYWEWYSEPIAAVMADICGVQDACKVRGINELLKLKSVRAATFVHASQLYKNVYNKQSSVGKGDGQDAQHFFLSSATGCFITHDDNLVKLLSKMDFPEIQVMTLKSLLSKVSDR